MISRKRLYSTNLKALERISRSTRYCDFCSMKRYGWPRSPVYRPTDTEFSNSVFYFRTTLSHFSYSIQRFAYFQNIAFEVLLADWKKAAFMYEFGSTKPYGRKYDWSWWERQRSHPKFICHKMNKFDLETVDEVIAGKYETDDLLL